MARDAEKRLTPEPEFLRYLKTIPVVAWQLILPIRI